MRINNYYDCDWSFDGEGERKSNGQFKTQIAGLMLVFPHFSITILWIMNVVWLHAQIHSPHTVCKWVCWRFVYWLFGAVFVTIFFVLWPSLAPFPPSFAAMYNNNNSNSIATWRAELFIGGKTNNQRSTLRFETAQMSF